MKDSKATKAAKRHNFRQARLMVIDDNEDLLLLVSKTIRQQLPEVRLITAQTEKQAVDYLAKNAMQEWMLPKMILLDLYVPTRDDGWRILQHIKALPKPIGLIPVAIISSSMDIDDVRQAYKLGAASYLRKPVTAEEWEHYVKALRTYWWETVTLPVHATVL